MRDETAFT